MPVYTLPYQHLDGLLGKEIGVPDSGQWLQPASIDLPIGWKVYRLSSSFIPYPGSLIDSLSRNKTIEHETEVYPSFVIEPLVHYLFELDVELELDFSHWGVFHTRSTAGRNDLLVSIIGDRQPLFNEVGRGYRGKLWMLVYSHSFAITVRPGDCLAQMRVQTEFESTSAMHRYLPTSSLRYPIRVSAYPDESGAVGWQAKYNEVPFHWRDRNVNKLGYFSPVMPHLGGDGEYQITLPSGAFTILRSLRQFSVAKNQALTIDTYVSGIGEFRSHYAGFVDPGFGLDEASSIVFEARSPYRLNLVHGQVFAMAQVEHLIEPTEFPYKGNYNGQDLRLAVQFI